MSLGVYSTIVGNFIDFFAISTDFSHGVFLVVLELLDDAVDNIYKDDLARKVSKFSTRRGEESHLKACYV